MFSRLPVVGIRKATNLLPRHGRSGIASTVGTVSRRLEGQHYFVQNTCHGSCIARSSPTLRGETRGWVGHGGATALHVISQVEI